MNALMAWVVARFTEKSSAVGISVMATAAFTYIGAADQPTKIAAIVSGVFGLVAFVSKDGHVLEFIPGTKVQK